MDLSCLLKRLAFLDSETGRYKVLFFSFPNCKLQIQFASERRGGWISGELTECPCLAVVLHIQR